MRKKLILCFVVLVGLFFSNILVANSDEITNLEKDLKIISRKEWGAKLPIKKMLSHKPDKTC